MIPLWRALAFLALAAQLVAAVAFVRHARRRPWSPAEVVALLLVASSLADLAGPWLRVDVVAAWELARLQAIGTWGTITLYQGWVLWSRPTKPCPFSSP